MSQEKWIPLKTVENTQRHVRESHIKRIVYSRTSGYSVVTENNDTFGIEHEGLKLLGFLPSSSTPRTLPYDLDEMINWIQSDPMANDLLASLVCAEADYPPFFNSLLKYMEQCGAENGSPLLVGVAKHLAPLCAFLADYKAGQSR